MIFMFFKKMIVYLSFITLFAVISCAQTPDPNFLPINLAVEREAPWETPLYTVEEMEAFFPSTNYSVLQSVYIATNGNDSANSGTLSNPYKTIQYAINNNTNGGMILRVKAGLYNEQVVLNVIASQSAPYVLYSEDGRGSAVIDGKNEIENLVIINGQYNIIDGFVVRNAGGYALSVFPNNGDETGGFKSYAIIRNNIVSNAGRDIVKSAHVDFLLIESNDISYSRHTYQYDNAIDGVAVYHTIVRYNYIHDTGAGTGGYFKGGSANNIWYNNIFKDIGDTNINHEWTGAGLQLGGNGRFSWRDNSWYEYPGGYGQIAYNNIFINCPLGAIMLSSVSNSQIYNNSFYNTGYLAGNISEKRVIIRVRVPDNIGTGNIEIYNNVGYNDSEHPVDYFYNDVDDKIGTGIIKHGYNTMYSESGNFTWNYPDSADPTEKIEDPLYNDPQNDDLTLQTNSPAIDSGANINSIIYDYNLNARPIGSGYDRGAYEQ